MKRTRIGMDSMANAALRKAAVIGLQGAIGALADFNVKEAAPHERAGVAASIKLLQRLIEQLEGTDTPETPF